MCISTLSDGISTLPYGHYRTVNASIFSDSNQDDDDDSERNVSETNGTSHHKDQDLDAWLKFFEEEDEIVDWDQESSNQEEIFTHDTNYGSEDSFLVLDTQPNRSLRDLLISITSLDLEAEWYLDLEAVETQHRSQRDAKQTKNSKVVCLIEVEYKI